MSAPPTTAVTKSAEPPSTAMKTVPPALHALGLIGAAAAGVLVNDPSVGPALGISTGVISLLVAVSGSLVGLNNTNKAEAAPPPPPLDADGEPVDCVTHYASLAIMHASIHGDQPMVRRLSSAIEGPEAPTKPAKEEEVKK